MMGQLATDACRPSLEQSLSDLGEHPMVRHEAAEALGAQGDDSVSSPTLNPSLHQSFYPYHPVYPSTHPSLYLSVFRPNYLPNYLPIYLPTYLPTYQPVYLFTYLPTCLPACLPIYLYIYLSTHLHICTSIIRCDFPRFSLDSRPPLSRPAWCVPISGSRFVTCSRPSETTGTGWWQTVARWH